MVIHKIIIDTNLWISLLIGKRLSELRNLCNNDSIVVYICDELISEFVKVSSSDKIRKRVSEERIVKTLELITMSCVNATIIQKADAPDLRDKKDLFLLSLAETIVADYILTGDKDLLSLQNHNRTKIVAYQEFISLVSVH